MNTRSTLAKVAAIFAAVAVLSAGLGVAAALTYPAHAGLRQRVWEIWVWCMATTFALSVFGLLGLGALAAIRGLWHTPKKFRQQ